MISYPAGLPLPLKDGYGLEQEENILRTPLASGRARQRPLYELMPAYATLTWLFETDGQARLFEAWARDTRAQWFSITLRTPLGRYPETARFMGTPQGPTRSGVKFWRYSARIELQKQPVMPPEWATLLPSFLLDSQIFDIAMNREWPTE